MVVRNMMSAVCVLWNWKNPSDRVSFIRWSLLVFRPGEPHRVPCAVILLRFCLIHISGVLYVDSFLCVVERCLHWSLLFKCSPLHAHSPSSLSLSLSLSPCPAVQGPCCPEAETAHDCLTGLLSWCAWEWPEAAVEPVQRACDSLHGAAEGGQGQLEEEVTADEGLGPVSRESEVCGVVRWWCEGWEVKVWVMGGEGVSVVRWWCEGWEVMMWDI